MVRRPIWLPKGCICGGDPPTPASALKTEAEISMRSL
jgi:hypothetical protein